MLLVICDINSSNQRLKKCVHIADIGYRVFSAKAVCLKGEYERLMRDGWEASGHFNLLGRWSTPKKHEPVQIIYDTSFN